MALTLGETLNNRYRVLELLGQGGFGSVYRAWDVNLDRAVALKENLNTSPEAQRQFKREAKILADLVHPNLPRVTDHFIIPGQGQYLVMDYVEGQDLGEMLAERDGPLPEASVIPWIMQVCEALEYLHTQDPPVIHRDIKPANIKITPRGTAVLVDFGIAKIFDPDLSTTQGARAVTPGYSPLEQYGQGMTDARSDIYALGATLYHLLTGEAPPASVDVASKITPPPKEALVVNPQLSPGLSRVIARAMEFDRDERWGSVSEFKAALRAGLADETLVVQTAREGIAVSKEQVQPTVPLGDVKRPVMRWIWVGIIGIASLAVIVLLSTALLGGGKDTSLPIIESPTSDNQVAVPISSPTLALQGQPDCRSPETFCVGLVTDVGRINDKSFNQSSWNGVLRAERELDALVRYIETSDPKDYDKNIAAFADEGYDVIVTVGFALNQATINAAQNYPHVVFIGVDQFQETAMPNLAGLNFPEDQAGFLVGALAAMVTNTKQIGAVCGTDAVSPVWRFGEGYRAGAAFIDTGVEVNVIYHNDVGFDKTFTDPEWGKITALSMIDKNVDVIFGAGGETGNGALLGAAEMGVFCIGVDTDQYFTVPEAQSCLISSAVKLLTPGVFDLISLAKEGNFPGGSYLGQVGYAPYHNFEGQIPDDVKARMEQILQSLRDGSLSTNVPPVQQDS